MRSLPLIVALVAPVALVASGCSDGAIPDPDLGSNEVDMAAPAFSLDLDTSRPGAAGDFKIISRGGDAVTYQAFPDVTRLASGDLVAVFYAGTKHISLPSPDYPRGGRICMTRSTDDGRSWSPPATLFDGPLDDRDPHITQISDGTVVVSFFTYKKNLTGGAALNCLLVTSRDGARTWDTTPTSVAPGFACSAPVRELRPDTWLQAVYIEKPRSTPVDAGAPLPNTYAAIARRVAGSWQDPVPLVSAAGAASPLLDGTEADVIALHDGRLLAVVRSDAQNMQVSTSHDDGKSWSSPADIGFAGHCPQLTRHSSGVIVLTHRYPQTALHISRDDGQTWEGAYPVDDVIGAYPTALELLDRTMMVIYYEEGDASAIRIKRFRLTPTDVEWLSPP